MLKKKALIRILLNSALGLVLIFIWSRFVKMDEIVKILSTTDPKFALIFISAILFSGILRGWRLKVLLRLPQLKVKDAAMLTFIGQFLSFLIPIRAGEFTKSVYLTSQFNLPLAKTLTWIFVDRALDLLVILMLIAALLPFVSTSLPANFINLVLAVLFGFVVFFVAAIKSEKFMKKIMVFLSNFLIISSIKKRFVLFTYTIIDGLTVLKLGSRELLIIFITTLTALLSDSLVWLSSFWALGLNIDFSKSVLGNSLAAFSFLVPAAPGYVGSAEAAGLAVFGGVLKMDANLASAGTVLFHVLTVVTLLILGVSSLYFLKFDLGSVWKKFRGQN